MSPRCASSSITRDVCIDRNHTVPTAAYQECRYPLCRLYAVRNGFCEQHAPSAARTAEYIRSDPRLSNLTPSNARFRRERHAYLATHAVCNMCRREAASILDHITPHRGVPALFWNQRNWQGLCVRCHGIKTAREVWGRGNAPASDSSVRKIFDPPPSKF